MKGLTGLKMPETIPKNKLSINCPKSKLDFLVYQFWGKEGKVTNYRITCEKVSCPFPAIIIQRLTDEVNKNGEVEEIEKHISQSNILSSNIGSRGQ